MCCRDWDSKNVLGDIKGKSIEEFWHGKKLNAIRNLHMQKKLDKVAACKDCEYKESYDWIK